MSLRRPVWALHVLVVGLALHNLVMSQLWRAGVRGSALTVIAAWKDVLLAGAILAVLVARRSLPRLEVVDVLALAFAAIVVVYAVIPQSALGGHATHSGVLYALRHDLLPVEAYVLGRLLALGDRERAALVRTILVTAAVVAAVGLLDVYLVPLSFWRHANGWYTQQLKLAYQGLSGLPENFIYNVGNNVVYRRLTSTFLSPLATGYLLVVALLALVALRLRGRWPVAVGVLLFAALLWTHTRAALAALVVGLLVLAMLRRAPLLLALAAFAVVVGFVFVKEYDHFAPRTHLTASEKQQQSKHAQENPGVSHDPTSAGESSTREHLQSLRQGIHTDVHHPWGFGLGNAGVTAARTDVKVEAGESTYTELAAETGLLGGLLFIAWSLALLRRIAGVAWLAAALVALLFLALQTDVIGIPWLAVVVWALAGSCVGVGDGPRRLFGPSRS